MKAIVDATKCEAYGVCAEKCPEVFVLDEWGYASVVGDGDVAAGEEENARAAAAACPENAIIIEG